MSADSYRFNIEIATKDAIRATTLAEQAVTDLDDSLGDTGSTARKVADVLARSAGEMEDELARAKKAGEALGRALGPELGQKIGQNRVNEWVTELRRAGLEMDDIEANADQLAASLGRLEAVKIDSIAHGFERSADGAERAKGVMSSFVGNAVTELPVIGTAFGPANEALSQFVEGAIQGEMGLKQIAAQAGPMAVIGGLVAAAAASFADLAAAREKEREAAEAALDGDLEQSAQLLVERYRMLYDAAADLGVSSETVTRALTGEQDAVNELRTALDKWALEAGPQVAHTYTQLITQLDHGATSWEENTKSITANRDLTREVNDQLQQIIGPTQTLARALDDKSWADYKAAEAAEAHTGALSDQEEALERLLGKMTAEDEFQRTILDVMGLSEELARINKQVTDGGMSTEEGMRRSALAINETKRSVILYLTEVLKVPPEVATEIAADVTGAEDDLAKVIAKLQEIYNMASTNKIELAVNPTYVPSAPTTGSAGGSKSSKFGAAHSKQQDSHSPATQIIVISPAGADPARWHTEQARWLRRNGTI